MCRFDITGESGASINILYTHWGRASMSFRPPVSYPKPREGEISLVGVKGWVGEMRVPFGQHKSPEIECSLEVIIFQLIETRGN